MERDPRLHRCLQRGRGWSATPGCIAVGTSPGSRARASAASGSLALQTVRSGRPGLSRSPAEPAIEPFLLLPEPGGHVRQRIPAADSNLPGFASTTCPRPPMTVLIGSGRRAEADLRHHARRRRPVARLAAGRGRAGWGAVWQPNRHLRHLGSQGCRARADEPPARPACRPANRKRTRTRGTPGRRNSRRRAGPVSSRLLPLHHISLGPLSAGRPPGCLQRVGRAMRQVLRHREGRSQRAAGGAG